MRNGTSYYKQLKIKIVVYEVYWSIHYKFKPICSIIRDKDALKYEYENNMDNHTLNLIKDVLIFK